MAGRKEKHTVEYFPHYVNHGKTIFTLEQKFGNDGYAFWFKLLELLGAAEDHYLDMRDESDRVYMYAQMGIDDDKCDQILKLLVRLEAIDRDLFKMNIIYSDNFVANLKPLYDRRKANSADKKAIYDNIKNNNVNRNTQSKVKESKQKKSKQKDSKDNSGQISNFL